MLIWVCQNDAKAAQRPLESAIVKIWNSGIRFVGQPNTQATLVLKCTLKVGAIQRQTFAWDIDLNFCAGELTQMDVADFGFNLRLGHGHCILILIDYKN